MHLGEKIERQKGGLDDFEIHGNEKQFKDSDKDGFELENINEDYINRLKTKEREVLYLEDNEAEMQFTSCCWEIQRCNPL